MKPYLYTKLFVPVFLFTLCAPGLCAPGLCAPAKIVRAGAASAKVSQRKQLLRYCISLGLLTSRIHDVQSAENNLLQHPYPSEGYNPQRPNDGVWARKMRAQVSYVHKLRQEAKSLTVPSVCQPANQELVASLEVISKRCIMCLHEQTLDRWAVGLDRSASAVPCQDRTQTR